MPALYQPPPAFEEMEYRYAEKDLRVFTKAAWRVLNPFTPFQQNWHLDAISDHLMGVTMGHIRRLVINIPPRHAKSTITSVFWPAWEWIQWPHIKSVYSSYKQDLSLEHSVFTRRIIESDWYQKRWSDRFMLLGDQNAKQRFDNDMTGYRIAKSFEAGPGGQGGDKLVVDDPLDPDEQQNLDRIEKINELWDSVYTTRLNDPARGSFVIIMQRLHDQDLSGHVLAQGWVHLCLPAEYDAAKATVILGSVRPTTSPKDSDPSPWGQQRELKICGYRKQEFEDPRDEDGELLWPDRFGPTQIAEKKHEMTSWAYAGQFNQDPVPKDSSMFPVELWKFWERPPVHSDHPMQPHFDEYLQSWDCAFKDTEDSDYVVGQVWARKGVNFYLLDQVRGQMGFGKTCLAIEKLSAKWPFVTRKLIEDKANGTAVIETLKQKLPGIIAVEPKGGKIARANATQPAHEGGNLYLPLKTAQWPTQSGWKVLDTSFVAGFVTECARFPKTTHDDQVDSFTQAINYWLPKMRLWQSAPSDLGEQSNTWAIT